MNKDTNTQPQNHADEDDDDLLGGQQMAKADDSMTDAVADSMVSDVFPTKKPKVQSWPTYSPSGSKWNTDRYSNGAWKNPSTHTGSAFDDMQDDMPFDDPEPYPSFARKGYGRRGKASGYYAGMTMGDATSRKNLGVALPITSELITNYIEQLAQHKGQRQVQIYLQRLMQFVEDRYMEA